MPTNGEEWHGKCVLAPRRCETAERLTNSNTEDEACGEMTTRDRMKELRSDYYVYAFVDPVTGMPLYIGKGRGQRASAHLRPCDLSKDKPLYRRLKRMVRESGRPPITYLVRDVSESEAFFWETFFVLAIGKLCDRTGPLFNLTNGGEGLSGRKHSEITKLKMSASAKGRIITTEARVKMSIAAKNRSEATRERQAASRRGLHRSDETKRKMSASRLGHTTSQETREKIRKANTGKRHTKAAKQKMSSALTGRTLAPEHADKVRFGSSFGQYRKHMTTIPLTGITADDLNSLE